MSSEVNVIKRNTEVQNKFYKFLETNSNELRRELIPIVKEIHNHQWTNGTIYNILSVNSNCYNNCKYCYMKGIKKRFFNTDIENLEMVVDKKKVVKSWKKVGCEKSKVIMFPSSHDIFDEYIDEYITVAKKMLTAGHTILIVTKPRLTCITKLISELKEYNKSILFRLTITTNDETAAQYYETNAPPISERIESIKLLFENGFRTSVSIEPFITDPILTVEIVNKFVTDDIWIGCMSGLNMNKEIDEKHKNELIRLYSKETLIQVINILKNNPKIFWKTSVMKILLSK